MSAKQWGHGFHTGHEEGHDEGYERGKEVKDFMLAEQINILLIELKKHMDKESHEKYVIWNAISKLNSDAMLNSERAAHRIKSE